MQHPVYDEELFMEEAVAAIRQAITKEEAGEAGAKPTPEAGLLSRQATAAVGSAFNTLTETVKKHEQTLEAYWRARREAPTIMRRLCTSSRIELTCRAFDTTKVYQFANVPK
jgi:hypothetical protein